MAKKSISSKRFIHLVERIAADAQLPVVIETRFRVTEGFAEFVEELVARGLLPKSQLRDHLTIEDLYRYFIECLQMHTDGFIDYLLDHDSVAFPDSALDAGVRRRTGREPQLSEEESSERMQKLFGARFREVFED